MLISSPSSSSEENSSKEESLLGKRNNFHIINDHITFNFYSHLQCIRKSNIKLLYFTLTV